MNIETPTCTNCGSTNVLFDAHAIFDAENNRFELAHVFDDHECGDCGEGSCTYE